jgi:hypothetical protein
VEPTVATFVFVLTDHVPPVEGVAVKVPVEPKQTEVGAVTVGKGFIVKFPVVA